MGLSISSKQRRVREWIKRKGSRSNLYFVTTSGTVIKIQKREVKDMVFEALQLSDSYWSARSNNGKLLETDPGRSRSALDLWRHIKTYRPKTSIYEVMEALYKLRKTVWGHYCSTVTRSVFWIPNSIQLEFAHVTHNFNTREFEFRFNEWKSMVNKKGGK